LALQPARTALKDLQPVMDADEVLALQSATDRVRLDDSLANYVIAIAAAIAALAGLTHAGLRRLAVEAHVLDPILLLEATVGGLVCLGLAYLSANAVIIARSLGEVAIDPDRISRPRSREPGSFD
ncbi:MAG: hypothetical protein ACKORL_09645, partial [Phycisphaerales bacterium]